MTSLSRLFPDSYVLLKSLFRYRGTLFWVIVFPILFYMLMIAIWGSPSASKISIGFVNLDRGLAAESNSACMGSILARALNDSGVFDVKLYNNEADMLNALRKGRVSVGLVVPEDFTYMITIMKPATVKVYYRGGPNSGYYRGAIEGFLSYYSDKLRSKALNESMKYIIPNIPADKSQFIIQWIRFIDKPLNISMESYTPEILSTKEGIRAFYAVGMIGVEVLFIGLSTGATSIIESRREGTLRVILSSPMSSWEILASMTISSLLAVAVSSASILSVSIFMGAKYNLPPKVAVSTVILIATAALYNIGLGLILSLLAKSEEAAMAIVNGISYPVMFIGGIVIPDFILPSYLREFAKIYPLSRLIEASRYMLIYNYTPMQALKYAVPAIVATVLVYVIGAKIFTSLMEKAVEG